MKLIKPLITEKSIAQTAKKKFTFQVEVDSSKPEIKKEIEKAFKVNVLDIKTSIQHGRVYRTGRKWTTRYHSDRKKAVVTIKPDQNIDLFEVTQTGK